MFASAYAVVRFLHLALYVDAGRQGSASRSAIAGFAVTVAVGMALLIGGSFAHGTERIVLWLAAAAIDYAGPAWLTRERLRKLQRLAVAHFAERYGLFVIICLGESIVAIGLGARNRPLSVALVAAVSLGLLITVGLWWTYFDHFAQAAEERLRSHRDPVIAAADAYSYLHLAIVAGIIVFAVGAGSVVHAANRPLGDFARLALCGGVSLYLVGHAAFLLRMVGAVGHQKLAAAAALLALYALGGELPGWTMAGVVAVVLAALCAVETANIRARRAPSEPPAERQQPVRADPGRGL
ncbi:MAG: hypothetical protein DLM64_12090 [Solirubrobacterales bacterium]|nr:MAG: hypothetical protein DLM64_12090 [Solirubrobacterales bacterium]